MELSALMAKEEDDDDESANVMDWLRNNARTITISFIMGILLSILITLIPSLISLYLPDHGIPVNKSDATTTDLWYIRYQTNLTYSSRIARASPLIDKADVALQFSHEIEMSNRQGMSSFEEDLGFPSPSILVESAEVETVNETFPDRRRRQDGAVSFSKVYFDVVLRCLYPKKCFNVLQCQKLFRKQALKKFRSRLRFAFSIPYLDGRRVGVELRLVKLVEYYVSCPFGCANGGSCTGINKCACTSSWKGPTCTSPVCTSGCSNGGTCTNVNVCTCATGWSGSTCLTAVCSSPCNNGGACSSPNVCTCTTGWNGSTCATPVCTPACANGGTCSSPGVCKCPFGWIGSSCSTPTPTLSFQAFVPYTSFGRPMRVAVGDVNGDGILDVAASNGLPGNLSLFIGNSNGTFQAQQALTTGGSANISCVVINDFNQDGKMDFAYVDQTNNQMCVLVNNGSGGYMSKTLNPTGSDPSEMAAVDLNNDTKLDIVVVNSLSNNLSVFTGLGDGNFASPTQLITGVRPTSLAVADFSRDGRSDIAVANNADNSLGIFLANGAPGAFAAQVPYTTGSGSQPEFIVSADFDRDDSVDIALTVAGTSTVAVFRNNGNGTFQWRANLSSTPSMSVHGINVGDFNQDTFQDIAVVHRSDNKIGIWVGHGNGTFSPEAVFNTGRDPCHLVAGDFNRDGRQDIVVATFASNEINILINTSA